MNAERICALGCAAAALWIGAVTAEVRDPVELEADEASYNHKSGVSIYRGNVKIVSGNMALRGDQAEVFTRDGEVERVIATANPSRFTRRDGDNVIRAQARRIEYRLTDNSVTMIGNVKIVDRDKTFTGEHVVYDIAEETFTTKAKKRIKLILNPKKKKQDG